MGDYSLRSVTGLPSVWGCLKRIGPETAEIKRMYVDPSRRREGIGRALLDELLSAARHAGYQSVRLDSPDFMTAAHALYRSRPTFRPHIDGDDLQDLRRLVSRDGR